MSELSKLDKPVTRKESGITAKEWAQYINEAKGLERNYLDEVLKSRKLAQLFGLIGFIFGLFMLFWHLMNPLTITKPYVLRVDNTTGAVDVVSQIKTTEKTYGEVSDRYWIANFVRHYENYAYQSIQFDYDNTLVMSTPDVGSAYRSIYTADPKNPNAPLPRDKQLGQSGTRTVKIISITPDTIKGIASIRFETMTTGQSVPEHWIATMSYKYANAQISENVRLLNPLGFLVTSYRVERENI
jgi:type IV secretion system protein VirB8